jgi:geranylgeranyl diphosphate synthase type II
MSEALAVRLDHWRHAIEQALEAALPMPPSSPAPLVDAMRYSLLAGGKRLRPLLCLAACEAVGGRPADAMSAAVALEFIHTYSLIHDDLPAMDDDTMRRGRPTLHVVAGEGMAILAGDALLTEAFVILTRRPPDAPPESFERALRVAALVARAAGAGGMVGGQAIDLSTTPSGDGSPAALDLDDLSAMHARKTGALIRAAAVAGAVLGGGDDDVVARIDTAATEFGLAFQIVDDILDVEGSSQALGKTAGKDAAAGKPTYPSLVGLARSREMATACVARAEAALTDMPGPVEALRHLGRAMVERSR